MTRKFFLTLGCLIPVISATALEIYSPTQHQIANFERINARLKENMDMRAELQGQLRLIQMSDERDLKKPNSERKRIYQAQKQTNKRELLEELIYLKRSYKKIKDQLTKMKMTYID